MFKKIDRLLWSPLKWDPSPDSEREFITDKYSKDEYYLRMNDFPDEPLWTLTYKEDSVDFDDTPSVWHITYRNEK